MRWVCSAPTLNYIKTIQYDPRPPDWKRHCSQPCILYAVSGFLIWKGSHRQGISIFLFAEAEAEAHGFDPSPKAHEQLAWSWGVPRPGTISSTFSIGAYCTKSSNLKLRFYLARNIKICREKCSTPKTQNSLCVPSFPSSLSSLAAPPLRYHQQQHHHYNF